jgi:aryl-alcohol dehydrogenase-like predicted oxidoreductase
MFHRSKLEKEFLGLFSTEGLGTTIWSPLASGILTGKYNKTIPKGSRMSLPDYKFLRDGLESKQGAENIKKVIKLSKIAEKLDISMAQLSIAWCLKNKNVSTVILGATTIKQLDENIKAAEYARLLDDKVMSSIEKILKNRPSPEPDML